MLAERPPRGRLCKNGSRCERPQSVRERVSQEHQSHRGKLCQNCIDIVSVGNDGQGYSRRRGISSSLPPMQNDEEQWKRCIHIDHDRVVY